MKRLLPFCLAAATLFTACNSDKTKEISVVSDDGKTKTTVDVNEVSKAADEMNSRVEELKKLTPYTLDELKALIPEEFMGMKRTKFSANSMMGTGFCSASYANDEGKELDVAIWDCAGEAGVGVYGMQYTALWNFQQEDDNGYQKTIDFKGGRAIEKYTKSNDEYGLTFIAKDRLLVTLQGKKMGLDGVKEAANKLF